MPFHSLSNWTCFRGRVNPDPGPPQPPAPLGADLQAKPRVDAVRALAVHHQALALEHVVQRQAAVAGAPPGQLSQAAYPPLAGRVGLPEIARRLPLGGGRHHFFDISMTSSSIRMSRPGSATMRFRRRFSLLDA